MNVDLYYIYSPTSVSSTLGRRNLTMNGANGNSIVIAYELLNCRTNRGVQSSKLNVVKVTQRA